MGRTVNTFRNMKFAIIGQILGIFISIISRKIFVVFLSIEYLGLNGLFSNILSMLSLAELGIGAAIVYSLYRPIAEDNIQEIKSLMKLYKDVYCIVGLFILVVGCSLTPFLHCLVKNLPNIPNIKLIYIIFVINTSISYFFTYKRSLIIATQKQFIVTSYHYGLMAVLNIEQIIALYYTQNFIIYLFLQVINTLLENFLISNKADRLYPYLLEREILPLRIEIKNEIRNNIFAMMFHRVGGVVVFATDNILIAKLVGLTEVGLYSNYILLKQGVNAITGQVFQSVAASFGDLNVQGSTEHKLEVFSVMNFVGAWIFGFCSICFLNLANPFIALWLGKEYLFPMDIVMWIVIVFYLSGMRNACLTARDTMGLFWYDRYKPLLEIIINIVASIFLGRRYGVAGIMAGTVISTLLTCFWIEPYVLYKFGFRTSMKNFFSNYIFYTIVTIISASITTLLCGFINGYSIKTFILRLLICAFIPNMLFLLCYMNTREFKILYDILLNMILTVIRVKNK